MKPRIGAYLSKRTAARLTAAAKRSGATKSALVEAALDRFLGSDDDADDTATLTRCLSNLSHQIERLDRDLKIVNETVALHARFHLAVTPPLPVAIQRGACQLGSARFEEFAAQVGRRIQQGTPLMQETLERLVTTRPTVSACDLGEAEPPGTTPAAYEPDLNAPTMVDKASEHTAAVREDGSNDNFPEQHRSPLH
jgi:hypothetical protein